MRPKLGRIPCHFLFVLTCPGGSLRFLWAIRLTTIGLGLFFLQFLKEGRAVAGSVGDVLDENHVPHQPVDTDVFPGYHKAVPVPAQLSVLGDMAR